LGEDANHWRKIIGPAPVFRPAICNISGGEDEFGRIGNHGKRLKGKLKAGSHEKGKMPEEVRS
jgi:hypothetical protein